MKTHKNGLTLLLSLVFISFLSCSDDKNMPFEDKLQIALDMAIEKYDVNGVSAAIIFSENKKWTGTSGISHDTVTIKPNMPFMIGSITKIFVAALTLKLVEQASFPLKILCQNGCRNMLM